MAFGKAKNRYIQGISVNRSSVGVLKKSVKDTRILSNSILYDISHAFRHRVESY